MLQSFDNLNACYRGQNVSAAAQIRLTCTASPIIIASDVSCLHNAGGNPSFPESTRQANIKPFPNKRSMTNTPHPLTVYDSTQCLVSKTVSPTEAPPGSDGVHGAN
eukprot:TRINITY_DN374_c0_g1_i3.p1 TRINITY_DN374_c0_g1~~TRINITY_DN374_c0_g1_i3.p1  ORF type:complete len:106 (-),score=7.64 TRINITY_DN374_c0_g1_i3:155-472(-)